MWYHISAGVYMVLVAETEGIEAHLKINWSTKFQCKN
jgi:hypothetical protein